VTELAVRQESGITPQRATRLAREKIYAGIPDDDVDLALAICARYNLDPLLKHVQLIPSNKKDESGKWTKAYSVYVTRDGLLHVAHESSIPFAVQFDEPQAKKNPYSKQDDIYLTGTLKREGFPDLVAGLWFSEYQATNNQGQPLGAWKTHPAAMHQKVVEVYLLRRGFDVSLPAYEEVQPDAEPVRVEHASAKSNGDNGNAHWVEDPALLDRMYKYAAESLGMSDADVFDALQVNAIGLYQGTMKQAKADLDAWADAHAKIDAAVAEVYGEEPAGE